MQTAIRLLFCFVSLAACPATVHAQERGASPDASARAEGETNDGIDWPSPDGKFAFLTSYGEDLHTIGLIDKYTRKQLQLIGEDEPGFLARAMGARFAALRPDDKVGASNSRSRCLLPQRRNFSQDRIA
jgi:hypothetical protein